MMKIITQIDARQKSRFMRGTYLPTLNIIASSKDSEQSFLEEFIQNKQEHESKNTLIVCEPQWVVDPRKDSPEKFWVAVGDKTLANELLPLNPPAALIKEYRDKGYDMWQVPIGYLDTFQLNLDESICSIIGIATAATLKYISGNKLNQIETKDYKNMFTQDVLEIGEDDDKQYSEFFNMSELSDEDLERPMFMHLDLSETGDMTGIAGIWVTGKNLVQDKSKLLGNSFNKIATEINRSISSDAQMLVYKLAFSVSIKAPKGGRISTIKHRIFINWLKEQGFNIKNVSCDTHQSSTLLGELRADGFNAEVISVDKTHALENKKKICMPYYYFKTAIYERRVIFYETDLLHREIVDLEKESDGHINHPENGKYGCFTGDTKVSLVDGRELTFLELIDEFNAGKQNYVYSFNHNTKHIEPKLIANAWCTQKNAQLVEVELDNGEKLRCTPNHKFMLRDGSYCEAQYLTSGTSLMPLYRKYPTDATAMKNYRMYYEPIEDAWHYEHRQFVQEVLDDLELKYRPPYIVKYRHILSKEVLNRTIKSIKFLDTKEDVYDITVPDNHNFALSSGVFVHNSKDQADAVCGAIWGASQHVAEYAKDLSETVTISKTATAGQSTELTRTQLVVSFEEMLNQCVLSKLTADLDRDIKDNYSKEDIDEYNYRKDIQDGIICF